MRDATRWLVLAVLVGAMVGCSTYELRGKAVEGGTSGVFVVDADDPRFERAGLPGASLRLTLDPQRLSAKRVGGDVTDLDGRFAIRVEEFGAGVLEYDAQLEVHASGFRRVVEQFGLPGRGKRVLVVLEAGESSEPPHGEGFLEETLRMGEPYME